MTKASQNTDTQNLSVYTEILGELATATRNFAENPAPDSQAEFHVLLEKATAFNPWFTSSSIAEALEALAYMVRPEALKKWLSSYAIESATKQKRVGLILAGNIPMVGFHDIFSVALSGNKPVVKLSSKDQLLLPYVFGKFYEATGNENFQIEWITERLPEVDAVIATGSNNTSRYFEYYFGKYPNIIRKNRSSLAILTGNESDEELRALGHDIFSNFGLGCRNVSKLYIHEDFDLDRFFKGIYDFHPIANHHKYANNYDYYRALWMLNQEDLLENGFMILRPSEALSSPIGTVFYERYSDAKELRNQLRSIENEIQCIVSQEDIPFGHSQKPELWDYADGVDTMEFLTGLG